MAVTIGSDFTFPTLGAEDTLYSFSYFNLKFAASESYTTDAFQITTVPNGTLYYNTGTATNPLLVEITDFTNVQLRTNGLYIDNLKVSGIDGKLYWMPDEGEVGVTEAFTVKAIDNVDGIFGNGNDVTSTDNDADGASVSINVVDIVLPPEITSNGGGATAALSYDENATSAVTTVTADIGDGAGPIVYSIVDAGDGALFDIDASTGELTFIVSPNFEDRQDANSNNVYEVTVEASDGGDVTDTQTISVTINDVNEDPNIQYHLVNQAAQENAPFTYTFDVDTFTDEDAGDTLTYTATLENGDPLPDWLNFNPSVRTFSGVPGDADTGVITIRVTADDGNGGSVYDDFALDIGNINNPPVITSNGGGSSAAVDVAENSTAVTTVIATDADLDAVLSYSISGGADGSLFEIDSKSGALSFKSAPDYENPDDAGGDNEYNVTVQVTDGIASDTQAITVTVTDVDEAPVIENDKTIVDDAEPAGTVVYDVNDDNTGKDVDIDGDAITYSITAGNGDGLFEIDTATGEISIATGKALDYDLATQHTLTVQASSSGGTDTADIYIGVEDNTPPTAPTGLDLASNNDLGASSSDDLTSQTTSLLISGSGEAGALVELFDDKDSDGVIDTGESLGTTLADGSGNWSKYIDLSGDGAHDIKAIQTDGAGNDSVASAALTITIDTTADAAPADLDLATPDDSGSSDTDNLTNQTTDLTISGTGVTDSVVTLFDDANDNGVYDNGEYLGSTTVVSGKWSIDVDLAEGDHSLRTVQGDLAGNVSDASAALTVTVDTTAPAVTLTAATDDVEGVTGTIASGGITNDTALVLSGTVEAGATVNVYNGATLLGAATVVGTTWSYEATVADGTTYNFNAVATDAAGNSSNATANYVITGDTSAPAAPSTPDLATASDSGSSNTDNITNDTTPTITGTGEIGASVSLISDIDGTVGTAVVDGSGNWSITASALTEGAQSLTATQTDVAGNTSVASAALAVTVDTSAPGQPAITSIADDTGTGSDGITSDANITVTGTAEADSTVELYVDGKGTGVTTTTDGSGDFTIDYTGTTLDDGDYALTVVATDAAGNDSKASADYDITVDTDADVVPTATVIINDGDGYINAAEDGAVSYTVSGVDADATADVTFTSSGGGSVTIEDLGNGATTVDLSSLSDGTITASIAVEDTAGNTDNGTGDTSIKDAVAPTVDSVAITGATGIQNNYLNAGDVVQVTVTMDSAVTVTGTPQLDISVGGSHVLANYDAGSSTPTALVFTYTILAGQDDATGISIGADGLTLNGGTIQDAAGNDADLTHTGVADNASYMVDTEAPAQPSITGIADDTATADDGITNDTTLVVAGAAETGATVELYVDGVATGVTATAVAGAYSIDYTGTTLDEGSYDLTVVATDVAGNESVASAAYSITVDTSIAQPTVTSITTDTGSAADDGITSDTTLVVAGAAETGATVELYVDGVATGVTATAVAGAYSIDYTGTTLDEGSYDLTVVATDVAGNESVASAAYSITVDTSIAQPTVTSITTDTGSAADDGITNDTTLVVAGAAETGATVELYVDGVATGVTATAVAGAYSIDYTGTTLDEGSYDLTVVATDVAGNESVASAAYSITVDTSIAQPTVTSITTDTGSAADDGITNDTTLVVAGAAETGATVELYVDGVATGVTATAVAGAYSIDYTGTTLDEGSYDLTVVATDVAGNESVASAAYSITVDTSIAQPTVTSITTDTGNAADDGITSDTTLVVAGAAETGATVELYVDGVATGVTATAVAGAYSIDYTGTTLDEGSYDLTVVATDVAGNESVASAAYSITVDTSIAQPTVTSITTDTGSAADDGITSDTTLVVAGAAETGATVELYVDGVATGVTATAVAGAYSIDYTGTTLDEGSYDLTVVATDVAGNESVASAAYSITVDTSIAQPTVTSITTDTGNAADDGITSDTTLVVAGAAETGATVELYVDGVATGVTATAVAGAYSIDYTGTTLDEGSYDLTVVATDVAGNESVASAAYSITVDTSIAQPTVTSITTDTGNAADDGITSDTTLVVAGAAETGATVELYVDGVATGVTATAVAGAYSIDYTGTTLDEGSYDLTVVATDVAGNESVASAAYSITVDTSAPAQPTVTSITTNTGSAADDGITNDTTLVVAGAAETGATVELYVDGVATGVTATAVAGAYSIDYTGTTLDEGSYDLTVVATDVAGNESVASAAYSITVDTSIAQPTVTSITTDTGSAADDGITSDTTLVVAGAAETGATVELYVDGVATGVTATAVAGAYSIDYTGTTLDEGSYDLTVVATDVAGNESVASAAYSITVDTSIAQPTVTSITTDTGSAADDGITSDTTLVVAGAAETGATVELYVDGVATGVTATAVAGAYSIDYTGTTLDEGSYDLTVVATDVAGNESVASAAYSITVDTSIAQPTVTSITTDTGSAADDGITSDTTLVVAGAAETGATVELYVDGVATGVTATAVAGAYSIDYTGTTLDEGSYDLTVVATDVAGNESVASAAYSITVDTSIAQPTVTSITTDTGSAADDGITSDTTLVVAGAAETGATVELYVDGVATGVTATAVAGAYSIDYTGTTLDEGSYDLTVVATDVAGNESVASAAYSITVDTSIAQPTVTSITTDTGSAADDGITNDTTLVVAGAAETGATVELYVDGVATGVTATAVAGAYSIDYTGTTLDEGSYDLTVVATDVAGNESVASAAYSITVDTSIAQPTVTSITTDTGSAADDGITNDTTLVVAGAAETGATVELYVDGVATGVTATAVAGAYSIDYTGTTLDEGSYDLTVVATDVAGNESVASAAYSITVDTSIAQPTVTSITTDTGSAADDGITSDTTLVVAGAAETGATVELYVDGVATGVTATAVAGAYSIDYTGTTLDEGSYDLTVVATDVAGNESVASAAYSITVDTSIAQPTVTSITTDTGSAADDGITSDTTLVVAGAAETGATVELYVDGVATGVTATAVAGAYSIDYTGTTLDEGSYDLTVVATDVAGNESVASAAYSITVDTSIAQPTVTSITTDTGSAADDGITNDTTLVVAGAAETGATVELYVDGVATGVTATAVAGAYSIDYTGTTLDEGSYDLTVVATDVAGNESVASAAYSITVDTSIAQPTVTSITTDTGSAADDGITSDTTLVVAGAAETGATVELYVDGVATGVTATAVAGAYSIDYTGTTLDEGSYDLTVVATDVAGNESVASAAYSITVDTSIAQPTVTSITTDTGSAADDGITSDTTLVVAGAAETGATVELYVDGVATGVTATAVAGAYSIDYTGTTLDEGSYDLTVVATDVAGNESVASAAYSITVDTSIAQPTVTSITTDTGSAADDGITSDTTLVVAGAAETGATVELYVDGVATGVTATAVAGAYSIDYTGTTLDEGSYDLTVVATDVAGNESVASAAYSITVDTSAPAQPTVTSITTDTGSAADDGITSDTTLVVAGAAETGATVELYVDGVATGVTATAVAGAYSIDYTGTTLDEGSYDLTVVATDVAGNESVASAAYSITVDTSIAQPTVTSITTDTGSAADDGITNDTTLVVAGAAETGATVELYVDGVATGVTATAVAGAYSIDYTGTTLDEGSYDLTVVATDVAGNESVASAAYSITVDTTAPTTTFDRAFYDAGSDSLTLTGTNMLTLLSTGESVGDDIKGNLDWSKLVWDSNGDDGVTANTTFAEGDIASAIVLDDSTLQIVLADGDNTVESGDGYGTGAVDTIDIAQGFSVDAAGNVATTDALANGAILSEDNAPDFAHPYSFTDGDTNVMDNLTGSTDADNVLTDFDASRGDTLMFVDYSATDVDSGGVNAGNTDITIDGTTITLTGYTDDLDGTVVVFDDGSLLKTNTGGSESLYGGIKGDLLLAGNSGDTLVGYSGNDILLGGDGNDVIIAGSGLDTITGGDGSDYIVLGSDGHVDMLFYTDSTAGANDDDGADFVSGFMAGDGGDTIHIADLTQSQVDAAKAGWISQSGSDTLINLGEGETIRLLGVDSSTLTDFNLVGDMPDL